MEHGDFRTVKILSLTLERWLHDITHLSKLIEEVAPNVNCGLQLIIKCDHFIFTVKDLG